MRALKAQASLCICTDSTEPSLLDDAISTKISCFILREIRKKYVLQSRFTRITDLTRTRSRDGVHVVHVTGDSLVSRCKSGLPSGRQTPSISPHTKRP